MNEVVLKMTLFCLSETGYSFCQKAINSHSKWLHHLRSNMSEPVWNRHGDRISQQYTDCMVAMTTKLSASMTKYDMYGLIVSILILWMVSRALATHKM